MHREVSKILKEIRGVNLQMLELILKEKNPQVKLSIDDTLSLKQTVYVYESAVARGFKIYPFIEDEARIDGEKTTKHVNVKVDAPSKVEEPKKKKKRKHIIDKKKKQDFAKKEVLDKWVKDFWDRAFASERKHNSHYDNSRPRMGEAGRIRRSRNHSGTSDSCQWIRIISTPMGGQNKKY